MFKPPYKGSITDVHGIRVGQAENREGLTGVTVVLCGRDGAVIGADVRGAAPGTREIALTWSESTVERANAVLLAGGSAFGLDAAGGVMRFLEEADVGVDTGVCKVPIVPAAVLFDLANGDAKVRPDAVMGYEACHNAAKHVQQGAFGAGTGATVGKLVPGTLPSPGGTGSASLTLANGVTVGAIACVNAAGDVYDPHTNKPLASGRLSDGKPVLCENLLYGSQPVAELLKIPKPTNTTLVVVATDAVLTKPQTNRMATCAHDGFARAIRPVHTQMDGDTAFALATGRVDADVNMVQLCAAAAEVVARAIANAVCCGAER
ncbi:MAG: P1 family peptidase [Clostridiales bacterium]|nr:P1 family peptidase [Clostridiales bacterium]